MFVNMFEILCKIICLMFLLSGAYKIIKSIDDHFDCLDKEEAAINKKWEKREKESEERDYRFMTHIQCDNARDFYTHRNLLDAAGISEAEFDNKLRCIGTHAIYNSIKNDTFHRGSDGRFYIGSRELLDVLGLD